MVSSLEHSSEGSQSPPAGSALRSHPTPASLRKLLPPQPVSSLPGPPQAISQTVEHSPDSPTGPELAVTHQPDGQRDGREFREDLDHTGFVSRHLVHHHAAPQAVFAQLPLDPMVARHDREEVVVTLAPPQCLPRAAGSA